MRLRWLIIGLAKFDGIMLGQTRLVFIWLGHAKLDCIRLCKATFGGIRSGYV